MNPTETKILFFALHGATAPEVAKLTYEAQKNLLRLLKQVSGGLINRAIGDDTNPFRFTNRVRRAEEIILRHDPPNP